MKWRARALVVVGSLGLIATSKLAAWELWSNEAPITQATLDDQTPEVRYAIHAELRGPGPFEGLEGFVAARIDVSPSQTTSVSTIEIRSLTHPDVMPAMATVPANVTRGEAFMDAWLDCAGDPCAEDFEVSIRRDPTATLPPLQVTGYIDAYAGSSTESTREPTGSEIVVTVTGPL